MTKPKGDVVYVLKERNVAEDGAPKPSKIGEPRSFPG